MSTALMAFICKEGEGAMAGRAGKGGEMEGGVGR